MKLHETERGINECVSGKDRRMHAQSRLVQMKPGESSYGYGVLAASISLSEDGIGP